MQNHSAKNPVVNIKYNKPMNNDSKISMPANVTNFDDFSVFDSAKLQFLSNLIDQKISKFIDIFT